MSTVKPLSNRAKKIFKIVAIVLAGIILLPTIFLTVGRGINALSGRMPDGVHERGYIELGGVATYVNIHGADVTNPVVIFLHGGPGSSAAFIGPYQDSVDETKYTLIYYDQRNSGRNYFNPSDTVLSVDLLLSDLDQLVDYAQDRFHQPIVIVGHSWGTVLGTLYAQAHPEKLAGYIGIGQAVSMNEAPRHGALMAARAAGNEADAQRIESLYQDLQHLKPFRVDPGDETIDADTKDKFSEFVSLLFQYVPEPAYKDRTLPALLSPDFDWVSFRYELLTRNRVGFDKYFALQEPIREFLFEFSPPSQLDLPVTFVGGSVDTITPVTLVQEYYQQLSAPTKRLFIMDGAGHSPMDEADSFESFKETMTEALATVLA